MSYDLLSANAVRALNKGAKMGGFAHDTGEGGYTPIASMAATSSGKSARATSAAARREGTFCPDRFAKLATTPQIKMIELKVSQGAKPGHGGVLPGAKVTEEISRIRGVAIGLDCISPARHSAFATPIEMMQFIARLRELSGGKPTGFKPCIGRPWEFMAIVQAMMETGITPDFMSWTAPKAARARPRSNSWTISVCRCATR